MRKIIIFILYLYFISGNIIFAQSKTDIINQVRESVVWIHAFNMPYSLDEATYKTGTGYVVGDGSMILTNNHVIQQINGLIIYAQDNVNPYYGTVIWSDSILDLAIIKAYNCKLKPLEFADAESIQQGDETLIFGYPGEGYKTGKIKVTWGLVSSDPADSTVQTTAAINSGNSGGPAINMQGKVIGTVYAKIVGLSIEGTGFIRNVKYAIDAVREAQNKSNMQQNYFGTTNFMAYQKICDAAILGWKAANTENITVKESYNLKAKELILNALDLDPNFVESYYYLAAYYLLQSRYCCMNNNDKEAKTEFASFKLAFGEAENKARELKPSLLFLTGSLNELGKKSKDKEISCSAYRQAYSEMIIANLNKEKRIEEFYNYLLTGQTPDLLKKAIIGYSYSSNFSTLTGESKQPPVKSTFFKIGYFTKHSPVRLSVCIPFGYEPYTRNLGFSLGNVGSPKDYSAVFCKYQFGFLVLQDLNETDFEYMRYLIPYIDLGIEGNFIRMARFNPKPYITVGWNPTNYQENPKFFNNYSHFYSTSGTFNFGIDLDIWINGSFGFSFSYQNTASIANFLPTLYGDQNRLQMEFSIFKTGIMF